LQLSITEIWSTLRRKEIQKQCFQNPPVPGTLEATQCDNFIKDRWEKEIIFLPPPKPAAIPSPAFTPSEEDKKNLAESQNKESIASSSQRESEMRVIQLPLINIKLLSTDFAPILVLLSLFFLYWLRLNLEFARNTLCSLYNDYLAANRATRTVPAHFVLLWPGGSRRRSHWVFWAILYSIIVSGLILIATDIFDFFGQRANHSVAISQ
jgi:hypothetical protein